MPREEPKRLTWADRQRLYALRSERHRLARRESCYPDEPDREERERVVKAICRERARKLDTGPRRQSSTQRPFAELVALKTVYHHPELD